MKNPKNVELKVLPETMKELQRRAQAGIGFNLNTGDGQRITALPIRTDAVPHLSDADIKRLAKG